MAGAGGVWGIDIGQSALKAMRCTPGAEGVIEADAFDYIEYPKILSQPEADPQQLVHDALEQFLSRNEVKGDQVAISVSGQQGLARFFKPPPVDAKKLPDLVKFEARQQIPFALEDVVWDYQRLGGVDVDGFTLETEVGLFAMKREQVYRALKPFDEAGIEVDIVQLSPVSIYNFAAHELLRDSPSAEEYDPEDPPPSLVVLAMGVENSDLVVTNGFRLWQRSIPLGGNHFTKALTKELKLTFAKAEHLKRNAREAEDPRAVFHAMRPIFNDLTGEVEKSIRHFTTNVDRKAKIGGVVLLGNPVKLPGLQQYLSKNLGHEVRELEKYERLSGSSVVGSPAFKENHLAFAACYGLCLQGLNKANLDTNLVPQEILTDRMIRAKKPWALAGVAAVMLGCAVNLALLYGAWREVHPQYEVNNVSWESAKSQVDSVQSQSSQFESTLSELETERTRLLEIGEEIVGNQDRRLLWAELLKAINTALPQTEGVPPGQVPDPHDIPYGQQKELHIEYLESEYFEDLSTWYTDEVKKRYEQNVRTTRPAPAEEDAQPAEPGAGAEVQPAQYSPSAGDGGSAEGEDTGPTESGWVVELKGYHYYNENRVTQGDAHVRKTLLKNLQEGEVLLPAPDENGQVKPTPFTMEELGVEYPVLLWDTQIEEVEIPNPSYVPPEGGSEGEAFSGRRRPPAAAPEDDELRPDEPEFFKAERYEFRVQFVWKENALRERLEMRRQKKLEQEQAEREAADTVAANLNQNS